MLLFTLQNSFAQTAYYKGEWTMVNKHDLYTGLFKIEIKKNGTATGEFVWTYLATDSTSQELLDLLKGKKGTTGIEYLEGNFSVITNDFYFEGIKKDDPNNILGLDKYHIKLSANKLVIYGSTETAGTNEGLLFAVKMEKINGEKEFLTAKTKVKK